MTEKKAITDPNKEQLMALYSALHDEKGSNALFITESPEDWQTLLTAGISSFRLNPDQDSQSRVLEMLQMKPTQKTIIVFNRRNDWQGIIRKAQETTTTDIQLAPAEILKRITALNENTLAPNASKYLKKIEKYCRAAEEQANPRPGNIADYLNSGIYKDELEKFRNGSNARTGFPDLDQKLGGGIYSGLYIIGATPGLGKTTFCLQIADQIAETGKPVLFFSLEQSRLELVTKSISRTARKMYPGNQRDLKTSLQIRLQYADNETMLQAMEKYKRTTAPNMHIIQGDFETTIDTIRATAARYISRNNVQPIIIIDYLQIVRPSKTSKAREQRAIVDEVLTELKRLSRDLDLPIIVISTLNRTNYSKTMGLESFKESGGVEYTADVAIGMQYEIISELDGKNENSDRERINAEKDKTERKILLVCLKNRYGRGHFKTRYKYYPMFDYFIEDNGPEIKKSRETYADIPII